jgi:hypothetical protein
MDSDRSDKPWLEKMQERTDRIRQIADDIRQSRTDFSHKLGVFASGTIAIAASAAGVVITKSDICPQMRASALYFLAFSATCMLLALILSLWRVHVENLILDDDYTMHLSGILQEIMQQLTAGNKAPAVLEDAFKKLEDRENELTTRISRKVMCGNWLNNVAIFFFCFGYFAIVILMWVGARSL